MGTSTKGISAPKFSRRDRHGRGRRGVLMLPNVPAWNTRREQFDEIVISIVQTLAKTWPQINDMEFGVEEVPPSAPAPWESNSTILGRTFSADKRSGLPQRIVVFRYPIQQRCKDESTLKALVQTVLVENIASALGRSPWEIDPDT